MPRLRTVFDDIADSPALRGPALRALRLYHLMEGRRLRNPACYAPSGSPPRYLLVQEPAEADADCGQWIEQGDDLAELLGRGLDSGWLPVELHDLDADGYGWGVEVEPRIVAHGPSAAAIERVGGALNELAAACGRDPQGSSIDALGDFMDAAKDLAEMIAAGWSV